MDSLDKRPFKLIDLFTCMFCFPNSHHVTVSQRTVSFIIYEKAKNEFPGEHQCSELGKQHIQSKKVRFFFKGDKTQLPVNVSSSKCPSLGFVSLHSLLKGGGWRVLRGGGRFIPSVAQFLVLCGLH